MHFYCYCGRRDSGIVIVACLQKAQVCHAESYLCCVYLFTCWCLEILVWNLALIHKYLIDRNVDSLVPALPTGLYLASRHVFLGKKIHFTPQKSLSLHNFYVHLFSGVAKLKSLFKQRERESGWWTTLADMDIGQWAMNYENLSPSRLLSFPEVAMKNYLISCN